MADLAERILAHIAKSDSRNPARADDVAAALDLAPNATAFTDALAELDRAHRINCATLQRLAVDPAPWLAIWPTGLAVDPGAWTANGHRALFVRHTPLRQALHQAAAPRVATPPAKEKAAMPTTDTTAPQPHLRPGELQHKVLQLLVEAGTALTYAEIAERTGRGTPQNIRFACKRLIEQGEVLLEVRPGVRRPVHAVSVAPPIVKPAPAAPPTLDETPPDAEDLDGWEPEAEPAASHDGYRQDPAAEAGPAPRFALWDNGTLDIIEPDRVLRLARPDVARLALLLGVPAA